jgi:outer membrane protein OmpA-like peptidoglycan-associated protein
VHKQQVILLLLAAFSQSGLAASPLKIERWIFFDPNSTSIGDVQLSILRGVACHAIANKAPLGVTAFASKHERQPDRLAVRRLRRVEAKLVELGVARSQLIGQSKGDTTPVADEGHRVGQAKNRRVELTGLGFANMEVCGPVPPEQTPV